ncbi:hypothetical protein [Cetobacterium sp.]|uniref:hypothetical protein n=2 Tax=Cetobacterium sp. TaxID=2071632 RepID=UPI003EE53209
MKERYKNICIRVDSELKIGSGFILKSSNNYYAITALHCITDKQNLLAKEINIWSNYGDKRIEFLFDKEKQIFFDEEIDLAIIKLIGECTIDKVKTKKMDELEAVYPIIDTSEEEEKNTDLVGYPASNRMSEHISLERSKIEIKDYKFNKEIGVFNKTNCPYEGEESLDEKLMGYSGSGIFYEHNNSLFLAGIFFKYSKNKSLGKAISPIKLIELFKKYELELPNIKDSYIKIKVKEAVDKLIEKQLSKDMSLLTQCQEFKRKIDLEIEEIEKVIISLNKEKYNYPLKKYIKLFIEKLYLLSYFNRDFEINSNLSAIKIQNLSAKLFISQYDDFDEMKSEFIRFINDSEIKINKMDNIYIKDIHNIDGGDFDCTSCRYSEKNCRDKFFNKILPEFNRGKEKNEKFNIMGMDRNEKNIKVKCADCISVNKKDKLKEIGDKLWG